MVKPETRVFNIHKDYGLDEAKKLGLFEWRKPFVKRYVEEGFPRWKRLKLSQISLNDLKKYTGKYLDGNAKIVESFSEAIQKGHVEKFPKMGYNGAHKKFTLMSYAFFNAGFFIESSGESKIYAHYMLDSNPVIIENSLVIVKSGSELTIVREIDGTGKLRVSTTNFVVEEGSKLNFFNVLIAPKTPISVDSNVYVVGNNAQVETYDVILGGDKSAVNHEIRLEGANAKASLFSFYFITGQERADLECKLIHKAPKTTGYLEGNGVIKENSYVVFRGNIWIPSDAYGVESREKSHSVNLSPTARVDAIPSLSVRNNMVTAEHGASMGSLDEKKLYYMMSRGMDKRTAVRLILEGVFEPLMNAIPMKSVKRSVKNGLFSRI